MTAVAVIKICRDRFPRLPTSTAARPSQGRRIAVDVERCNGGTSLPRRGSPRRVRAHVYTPTPPPGERLPGNLPTYLPT